MDCKQRGKAFSRNETNSLSCIRDCKRQHAEAATADAPHKSKKSRKQDGTAAAVTVSAEALAHEARDYKRKSKSSLPTEPKKKKPAGGGAGGST